MNPNQLAPSGRLEEVVTGASPALAADSLGLNQVMSKLRSQYLPAAFRARAMEMNHRVWSALGAYLTSPTTSRKLFVLSEQESAAVVRSVRELAEALHHEG